MVVLLCIVGPVLEEIYYRGYVYNILKNRYNPLVGAIVSSFLYMLLHDFKIHFLYLFIPGLMHMCMRKRKIYFQVLQHIL